MALADVQTKLDDLHDLMRGLGGVVVAFSGGADSALVAAVAARTLPGSSLAVTAVSPSLPPGEADDARRFAREIGIRHLTIRTHETEKPEYLANGLDRCYHCKSELYDTLTGVARREQLPVVASGANADDLGDFRPGLRAAAERSVRHPLVETGFTKFDVRAASATLDLRTADKPASACLSSRFAFGVRISVEELSKVGQAEKLLKELGFRQCRVRVHDDLVRVEVEAAEVARLAEPDTRARVVDELRGLGYRYVTVDLEGFRSGSMNP
ncbi:MAG: ATP-dependent sacrificial sulfur transferase LarE [Actinomycetota bacterium]